MNKENEVNILKQEAEEENPLLLVLRKPYEFEGKDYKDVDLSGLDDLTAKDMIAVNRQLDRNGSTSFLPEMTLDYACTLAARATKLPIEFFTGLHPKDAQKLKSKVTGFLYGSE
jgi:hypothetical protein|uniref:Tail assembly chaperone n=1 Tax=Caudovirales sp. ctCiv1 TaxID=2826769 RepID=A0A8S5M8I4_9CAUD|nr:phage tail assembly protein [uncultured Lachnoclostridium sp.]DAD78524.1 MAG TPA: tail assembly chaperone [Caudovirales sp. ctCiv1]